METRVKTTVSFRPDVLRRLREAAHSEDDLSSFVNESVEARLREDAEDAERIERRRGEDPMPIADFRRELERDGLI